MDAGTSGDGSRQAAPLAPQPHCMPVMGSMVLEGQTGPALALGAGPHRERQHPAGHKTQES